MPSAVAPKRGATSWNDHEGPNYDQADYDQAVNDFMRDLDFDNDATNAPNAAQEPPKDIDEEVQVKKKRKPNPKLDEARLLSQNGIPKLRRLTKSKLKFRGKGHEYADITTLLNMYQLWLDDLYPKAKFKDGLVMVEKVGHSKRMQITRRAWLDSTKPHQSEDSPERIGELEMSGGLGNADAEGEGGRGVDDEQEDISGDLAQREGCRPEKDSSGHESAPEDDELDALMNENAGTGTTSSTAQQALARGPFEEDSDVEDDELDALMAEEDFANAGGSSTQRGKPSHAASGHANDGDDFADDEEAMASMDW